MQHLRNLLIHLTLRAHGWKRTKQGEWTKVGKASDHEWRRRVGLSVTTTYTGHAKFALTHIDK